MPKIKLPAGLTEAIEETNELGSSIPAPQMPAEESAALDAIMPRLADALKLLDECAESNAHKNRAAAITMLQKAETHRQGVELLSRINLDKDSLREIAQSARVMASGIAREGFVVVRQAYDKELARFEEFHGRFLAANDRLKVYGLHAAGLEAEIEKARSQLREAAEASRFEPVNQLEGYCSRCPADAAAFLGYMKPASTNAEL
jgi:hypothetical protein